MAHVPAILLHGRYDLAVPLASALDLKAAMPWADLRIVEGAGHSAAEPAMPAPASRRRRTRSALLYAAMPPVTPRSRRLLVNVPMW